MVRFAQLEVDQLRSVAFVESALQFGRMTYIGADPNNASRAYLVLTILCLKTPLPFFLNNSM